MKRRVRTFAALLALATFSASFAEQARAGTCAPAEEVAAHHTAPGSQVQADAGQVEMPSVPAPHRGRDAPEECPLQAMTAGCALLLPPTRVSDAAALATAPRVLIPPFTDPSPEILLVWSFFRPPQR